MNNAKYLIKLDKIMHYLEKSHIKLRPVNLIISVLVIIFIIAGCNPVSSTYLYDNSKSGINLERPGNWKVEYDERNGLIVLRAEKGFWHKESARIEIVGTTCFPDNSGFTDMNDNVMSDIDRIKQLYNLETVNIIQLPTKYETKGYEISKVIIEIPTTSMLGDPIRLQVRDRGSDVFQTIEIFGMAKNDRSIMTYIYV